MNIPLLLEYGNHNFLSNLAGLSEADWANQNAVGIWSPKDILAHVTVQEFMLAEVLGTFVGQTDTPYMAKQASLGYDKLVETEIMARRGRSVEELLDEYKDAHSRVLAVLPKVPANKFSEAGTLPWYGEVYALDDFIVYNNYGHKIEHTAQLALFRDTPRGQ